MNVGSDAEGRRRQIWRTVPHGNDPQALLTELLREHDRGALQAQLTAPTLGKYLEQIWFPHIRTRVRETTLQRYQGLARDHILPVVGAMKLSKIRPVDVQRIVDEMVAKDLAARSVVQGYRVLSAALAQAVRWEMIPTNPAKAVRPPRVPRPDLVVPDAETMRAIVEAAEDTPGYVPILIAASTGMRRGEVAGLRWRNVDLEAGRVTVTATLQRVGGELTFVDVKTPAARRTLAMPSGTVAILKDVRTDQARRRLLLGEGWTNLDLVVERGDGLPHDPDSYTHWIAESAARAGSPGTRFHDLRHGYATALLREGIHPKVVSEALGHTNVGFTLSTYAHVIPTMQDEAGSAIGRALGL